MDNQTEELLIIEPFEKSLSFIKASYDSWKKEHQNDQNSVLEGTANYKGEDPYMKMQA
jgi:hypothetical protein